MKDHIVKYGDLTIIHALKPLASQQGILLSKGFSDPDLYFASGDLTDIKQLSIFQLLPRSSFQIHEQAAQTLEKQIDIKSRKEKQIEQFNNNIKLMQGEDLHFGETFILKHVISKSYLKGSLICGEGGFGSFKLELTNQFSNDILFKIATYRSFEKEGEKFRYDTPFKLHHIKSNSYTNYSENEIFISREFNDNHPYNLIKQPIRYPTGNQSKSDLLLKLESYDKFEVSKIQNGDIVKLKYSQNSACLSYDIMKNQISLKDTNDRTYDGLWEVRYHETSQNIYLVNYLYKTLLGIKDDEICLINDFGKRLKLKPINQNKQTIENQDLINLTYQNYNVIKTEKFIKKHQNKLLEIYDRNNNYYKIGLTNQVVQHSFKVIKISDNARTKVDMILSSTELLIKLRCMLDLGVNKQSVEVEIINQYSNFLQEKIINTLKMIITKLYECNYFNEISLPGKKVSHEIALILKDLGIIDLIIDIIESFGNIYPLLKNFDQFSGQANQIESLIEVFYYCYEIIKRLCIFSDFKLYISKYLQLFLKHFYQIKENFVEEFLWQILTHNHSAILYELPPDDISLNIEKFNQSYQKDNIIIDCPGSSYIKLLRFFCFSGKQSIRVNQDLVKKQFFNSNNKCIIYFSFQENMIKITYQEEKRRFSEFFESNKDKETWNYFYQYLMLLADITIHQNTENSDYIAKNIISYETLCQLLNSEQLKQIQKQITSSNTLSNTKIRNVMNPLIRLAHTCYIDVQGFQTIRRIAKVREWKGIETKVEILKSHAAKKKNQINFINKILAFIQSYLRQFRSTFNFEYNRALLSLLDLLRSTITLGFWDSIEQFRELMPLLINVVKYESQWIIEQVQEQSKGKMLTNSQLQALMSQHKEKHYRKIPQQFILCKIRCLDIIDIMMDMETNTRVSILTHFYKCIHLKQLDFAKYSKKFEMEFDNEIDNEDKDNNNILKFIVGDMVLQKKQKEKDKELDVDIENENLWLNKMKELTPIEKEVVENVKSKRYVFDRFNSIDDVFLSLMELSEYRNYELMSYALLIMSRMFGQRKDVINNFENVIIVAEGNFNKLSKTSREEIRSKLKFLELPNITQLKKVQDEKNPIRIWKYYNKAEEIKEEKLKSGVIQDLTYLIQTMKIGRSVEDSQLKNTIPYEYLGSKKLFLVYNQRDEPNSLYQKLIKNQDSHIVLLKYIDLINNPTSDEIHIKCLHSIYNYLTMLIWNHSKNKLDLTKDFKLVCKHIHWNIGVADFLKELFKNNEILYKEDISDFIEVLMKEIVKRGNGDYYKAKLLDVFRPLTIFNDHGIKERQLQILSVFQKIKFQSLNLDKIDALLQQYSANYNNLISNCPEDNRVQYFKSNKLAISPELTFIKTFFHIFSCMIESSHSVNIGKCSNFHSYEMLLNLIEKSYGCWPLHRYLRGYINRLYYIPVEYDILMFDEFVKREIKNLIRELEKFIIDYEDSFETHSMIEIENPVRFNYLASYTYCSLIECLTSFYEMLMKKKFVDHLKHAIESNINIIQQTLNLIQLFGYIHFRVLIRRGKSRFLMAYLKNIKKAYFQLLDVIPFKYLYKKYDKAFLEKSGTQENVEISSKFYFDQNQTFFRNFIEMIRTCRINNVRENLLKNIQSHSNSQDINELTKKIKYIDFMFSKMLKRFQHFKFQITNLQDIKEIKVVEKTKEQLKDDQNLTLNEIHQKICQNMQNLTIFKNYKDNEFMQFVKIFLRFDQLEIDFYKNQWKVKGFDPLPIVTIKDFIISVIDMIRLEPASIKTSSKIEFIKILRLFITESVEEGKHKVSVDQWTPEYIQEENKQKLIERQDFLINSNCHLLIFAIFKQSLNSNIANDLPILNEILLLTIALLFGGNRKCQQTLLESMRNDLQNQILISISQIIKYLGTQLYKLTKIHEKKVKIANKFQITTEDTFDFFNFKQRTMERKFLYTYDSVAEKLRKNQKSQILSRTFRFLQLLCENNNYEMKIFLRQQTDKNGNQILNSINFIEETTFLLRRFFKIMNINIIEIQLFLLDFINEVTQLPCVENQMDLCKSSYFEDVCFMEAFMTEEKRSLRLIEDKEDIDKLYEIYNKTVSLALSNMEGNKTTIFEQIRNKLSLGFLKSLAVYNFQEILDYYEINPKSNNNSSKQEKPIISEETVSNVLRLLHTKQIPDSYIHLINIISLLKKQTDNRSQNQQDRMELFFSQLQPFRALIKQLLRIEVNLFSKQYIYFPRFPLFSALSKQTRSRIMQEVDRETQRDKLNGLFGFSEEIIEEMEVLQTFQAEDYDKWRIRAIVISVVLNIITGFGIEIDVEYGSEEVRYHYTSNFIWVVIKLLTFLQLFLSFYYIRSWYKVRSPLAFKKELRSQGGDDNQNQEQEKDTGKEREKEKSKSHDKDKQKDKEKDKDHNLIEQKQTNWNKLKKKLKPLINFFETVRSIYRHQSQFGSIFVFIMASLLGLFLGPQFYSLHLVGLFSQAAIMKSVFEAITSNIQQLLTVSLLGVFFIYTFSINGLAFALYYMPEQKQTCQNVMDCLLTLYISGSIGDDMETFQFWRFLGDLIYIVVMELLFSNIVSGIMIDTFAELRDKKKEILEDMNNKCFICGVTRSDVEKRNKDFESHIKQEHYLWNYIFYIYCLKNKDETDYSGIEYSISQKLEKEDLSWIPVEEENEDGGEKEGVKEAFDKIMEKLGGCL